MRQWDPEGFWSKSKVYIDKANEADHASQEFAFWSSLALELLARAALTKVHPALNADPQQDTNLLYGFGFDIAGQPRSLPAHSVYARLEKIIPDFGKPQRELCDFVGLLRNQELHTAEIPFDSLKVSKWLPRFYEVAGILCKSLGKTHADLLGTEVSRQAEKLVATLNKEQESAVKSKVAAHSKVFSSKPPEEQKALRAEAAIATKMIGHGSSEQKCPACQSPGVLRGDLARSLKPEFEEETAELFVEEVYLANAFHCPACDLSLDNVEEINLAGLEPTFSQTRSTDLHEMFQAEYHDDHMNM
jgi:hypothetical protein